MKIVQKVENYRAISLMKGTQKLSKHIQYIQIQLYIKTWSTTTKEGLSQESNTDSVLKQKLCSPPYYSVRMIVLIDVEETTWQGSVSTQDKNS